MNNETDFKELFCKSVKEQGGFTFKIAASIMNGLPDLYCVMPGFVPIILEGKFIKNCGEKFKRKIQYRPLQREILKNANSVNKGKGQIAFCLLGIKNKNNNVYCCLISADNRYITEEIYKTCIEIKKDKSYLIDVKALFTEVIPKF